MNAIDKVLDRMRKSGKMSDMKEKGNLGEEAVFQVCSERINAMGTGLLYQSVLYPYQTTRDGVVFTGNIKYENGEFVEYTDKAINDEIDILYVSTFRIFPIEVKSYHVPRLDVYDHWFNKGNEPVDKSPVMQAEKHARHLYHAIHDVIPDGNPNYIVPIVCFVDRCTIRDDRSPIFKTYIPVCILNNLKATIAKNNIPLEYNLSLKQIDRRLKEVAVSIKREN